MESATQGSQDRWVRTGSILQQQAAALAARLIEGLEHSSVFAVGRAEIRIVISARGDNIADSSVLSRSRSERHVIDYESGG